MKANLLTLIAIVVLASALVLPAHAQIVYTQVNVSIPVGESYNLDLNGDGVTDFTLKSKLLQGYCQSGDEYVWSLTAIPSGSNDVVTATDQAGSEYASALQYGASVNASQSFYPNASVMADLNWGACGVGMFGEWLNLPNRYLGLQFQTSDGTTHYAWAKLSTAAYVDQDGHLHASTLLTGFAYQASAGEGILAGATQ
jgi:hypothetical protein